jgi:hypothetical protein
MKPKIAVGAVVVAVLIGVFVYIESPTKSAGASYENKELGFKMLAPGAYTISDKLGAHQPRSHLLLVEAPHTANGNSYYYGRILINYPAEGTMGPDDVAPTVSSTTIQIAGQKATRSLEQYADTGKTFLEVDLQKGSDWYHLSFPYTTDQEKATTDGIVNSIQL